MLSIGCDIVSIITERNFGDVATGLLLLLALLLHAVGYIRVIADRYWLNGLNIEYCYIFNGFYGHSNIAPAEFRSINNAEKNAHTNPKVIIKTTKVT